MEIESILAIFKQIQDIGTHFGALLLVEFSGHLVRCIVRPNRLFSECLFAKINEMYVKIKSKKKNSLEKAGFTFIFLTHLDHHEL